MRNGAAPFVIRRDVWADDQVVVLVTGEDRNALRANIMTEADRIYSAIDGKRDERVAENLFRFGEREALASELAGRFGWRMRIPFGFNLIDTHADSGFVVFSRTHARVTQWLFVYHEEGVPPDRLTEAWCIRKRNETAPAAEEVLEFWHVERRPVLARSMTPVYPEVAMRAGLEGDVFVAFTVGANGSVRDVRVLRGPDIFRKAAVEAVSQFVFEPAVQNDRSVAVKMTLPIRFRLSD